MAKPELSMHVPARTPQRRATRFAPVASNCKRQHQAVWKVITFLQTARSLVCRPAGQNRKMNWLRNKRFRAGAEVSLATSATVPNSGTKSVDNSQGSSAAVSELVSGLDFVLDEWDCEGKLIIFLRLPDWYSTVHEC
jgi:hypothetical protein